MCVSIVATWDGRIKDFSIRMVKVSIQPISLRCIEIGQKMSGRSIKRLMQTAHPDWDGGKPARIGRNSVRYRLENGDFVYQCYDTVVFRCNPKFTIAWLNVGPWNTTTTRERINNALDWLYANTDVGTYTHWAPRLYTYKHSLYYLMSWNMRTKPYWTSCVFEFENNMQINLVKGVWIPNTAEVTRYCGIAKARRTRAQDIKP